jgi:D-serine deaminase-like pyridoxal phosphate-dependent protein
MIHITAHATARYQERVDPVTFEEARAAIMEHAKAIETAASIGCNVVRCGRGERLILDGETVITVYQAGVIPRQCRSRFWPGAQA